MITKYWRIIEILTYIQVCRVYLSWRNDIWRVSERIGKLEDYAIEDYVSELLVHCLAIQMGFESNLVKGTALVHMHSTC